MHPLAALWHQAHRRPENCCWRGSTPITAYNEVIESTIGGAWYAAAFEFGPNAGQGAASAGYANFNNTSANSIFGDPGTVASATIENVTTGAAYVVVVFDRSGGSIESVPGSPWTGLQNFLGVTGTGVAWLVAPNADPIPISFDVIDNESWTLASSSSCRPLSRSSPASRPLAATRASGSRSQARTSQVQPPLFSAAPRLVRGRGRDHSDGPAGSGTVNVTVTNANGSSPTSSADEFVDRYAGPFSLNVSLSQASASVTLAKPPHPHAAVPVAPEQARYRRRGAFSRGGFCLPVNGGTAASNRPLNGPRRTSPARL